ncbi:MAG: PD-(D/E)XK nuclease family protein [Thermonemataceae bacterium]|nr:PD-(D/E)XK nuclease family protein [Thermonemataceae bacterium]
MTPFLLKAYQHILLNFDNLEKVCLLVPSRRSMRALKKIFLKKNGISPVIFAIDDFIKHFSGLKKADNIELLLILQKIAREIIKEKNNQDNLLSWLPTLLKDYNSIDQNLAKASLLFKNLADIERIKQWDLTEYRKQQSQDKLKYYFEFWDKLFEVYEKFKEFLQKKGIAYAGMMYRHLAENLEKKLLDSPFEQFIWIGFNAFSKSEEYIVEQLLHKNKATLLWDTDDFYMEHEGENPAGKFLKKYKKKWGKWLWQEKKLLHSSKQIEIIACSGLALQAQVSQKILETWEHNKRTAVVLPDENLLFSLLHTLDEQKHFKGYNITMGLSLQNSTLFSLFTGLFDLQQNKRSEWKTYTNDETGILEQKLTAEIYHKDIFKILNHPFIRKYERLTLQALGLSEEHSFTRKAVQFIIKESKPFVKLGRLRNLPKSMIAMEGQEHISEQLRSFYEAWQKPMELLFGTWDTQKIDAIAKKMLRLLSFFEQSYQKEADSLEFFYLDKFKHLFKKLRYFLSRKEYVLDFRTFKNLFLQLVNEERIPFDSKENSLLQIMGLLETRTLDFDQVIILGANEGSFPQVKRLQSLIPIDIAREFGLPTSDDFEAIQSYHFYRLLQRAKRLVLVYNASKSQAGSGSNEVSRYALQLEQDIALKNEKISVKKMVAQFPSPIIKEDLELHIVKSEEILTLIKKKLEENLSPSALNTFITCSLKFYFSYIARIQEAEEVNEEIEADIFGKIIHKVLEDLFFEASENFKIGLNELQKQIPNIKNRVEKVFQEEAKHLNERMIGSTLIAKEAAIYYIKEFLEQQMQELESEELSDKIFEILSLENKNELLKINAVELVLEIQGEKIPLKLRGVVDRVDKLGGVLRIIDYKTGKVEADHLKLSDENIENIATKSDLDKLRQIWIYTYLAMSNLKNNPDWQHLQNTPIEAGFYSLRNLKENFLKSTLSEKFQDKDIFKQKTENWLREVLTEMLDTDKSFEKTQDIEKCEYCTYKNICSRG